MGKANDELIRAGVPLAAEGLDEANDSTSSTAPAVSH